MFPSLFIFAKAPAEGQVPCRKFISPPLYALWVLIFCFEVSWKCTCPCGLHSRQKCSFRDLSVCSVLLHLQIVRKHAAGCGACLWSPCNTRGKALCRWKDSSEFRCAGIRPKWPHKYQHLWFHFLTVSEVPLCWVWSTSCPREISTYVAQETQKRQKDS